MPQIDGPLLLIVAALLAAIIGYANQHGGTCTVAAVSEAIERQPGRLLALAEAGLWAFALGTVMKMAGASLPPVNDFAVTLDTIIGGALLGLGAWLNKACLFGTLTQLGRRNPNYLFTLTGLFAGYTVHNALFDAHVAGAPPMQPDSRIMLAVGSLFLASLAAQIVRVALASRNKGRLSIGFGQHEALIIHALAFTVMASIAGVWTYGDLMSRYAHGGASPDWMHLLLVSALLAGALFGGWRTAQATKFLPCTAMLCFTGGSMMAIGSSVIPGGNDLLILYAAPLLQWHAIVAIGVMLATIAVCILLQRVWGSLPPKTE